MRAEIRRLNAKVAQLEERHFLDLATIVLQRRQIEMLQEAAERKTS